MIVYNKVLSVIKVYYFCGNFGQVAIVHIMLLCTILC